MEATNEIQKTQTPRVRDTQHKPLFTYGGTRLRSNEFSARLSTTDRWELFMTGIESARSGTHTDVEIWGKSVKGRKHFHNLDNSTLWMALKNSFDRVQWRRRRHSFFPRWLEQTVNYIVHTNAKDGTFYWWRCDKSVRSKSELVRSSCFDCTRTTSVLNSSIPCVLLPRQRTDQNNCSAHMFLV